jgi:hypothetical protein
MNHYMMIRRLRGPAFLLLVGVNALLAQANILGWGKSWPFYLILAGVLRLAERAALAADGGYPQTPYPGYPGASCQGAMDPTAGQAQQTSAIVPAASQDFGRDSKGGQS